VGELRGIPSEGPLQQGSWQKGVRVTSKMKTYRGGGDNLKKAGGDEKTKKKVNNGGEQGSWGGNERSGEESGSCWDKGDVKEAAVKGDCLGADELSIVENSRGLSLKFRSFADEELKEKDWKGETTQGGGQF